jgi:DNA-binding GntR family transcriptional regulator
MASLTGIPRSAEIYAALKARIVAWDYPPDYRLTEEDLCSEFKVSRSPVREALRMLEHDGLVAKIPHRGCRVLQLDVDRINEHYDVRQVLEVFAVTQLATQGMPPEQWEALFQQWEALLQVQSAAEFAALDAPHLDEAFHEALAAATGNQTLHDFLRMANERLHFVRAADITTLERLHETCHEHLDILRHIAARDPAAASAAIIQNIEGGRKTVRHALHQALLRGYMGNE